MLNYTGAAADWWLNRWPHPSPMKLSGGHFSPRRPSETCKWVVGRAVALFSSYPPGQRSPRDQTRQGQPQHLRPTSGTCPRFAKLRLPPSELERRRRYDRVGEDGRESSGRGVEDHLVLPLRRLYRHTVGKAAPIAEVPIRRIVVVDRHGAYAVDDR